MGNGDKDSRMDNINLSQLKYIFITQNSKFNYFQINLVLAGVWSGLSAGAMA